MSNIVETKQLCVKCPHCPGILGTVDHLIHKTPISTAWYCDDCHRRTSFTVGDGKVDYLKEKIAEWCFNVHILVETVGADAEPLRFMASSVMHCLSADHKVTLEDLDNKQFWVNENTSVTNWLNVNEVWRDSRRDPDGFRFLAAWGPNDIPTLVQDPWEHPEDRNHDICYLDWLAKRELTQQLRVLLFNAAASTEDENVLINRWIVRCGGDINQWFLLAGRHLDDTADGLTQDNDSICWTHCGNSGHFTLTYDYVTKVAKLQREY